jgi:hypothetical protein
LHSPVCPGGWEHYLKLTLTLYNCPVGKLLLPHVLIFPGFRPGIRLTLAFLQEIIQ